MRAYWTSLSVREKILIGAAGLISLVASVQIFLWKPANLKNLELQDTLRDQNATLEALAILPRQTVTSQQDSAPAIGGNIDSLRAILLRSATDAGLSVNRVQANNRSVTFHFDQTIPELFFLWVRSVEVEFSVAPEKFSVRRRDATTIRASVEFTGA